MLAGTGLPANMAGLRRTIRRRPAMLAGTGLLASMAGLKGTLRCRPAMLAGTRLPANTIHWRIRLSEIEDPHYYH